MGHGGDGGRWSRRARRRRWSSLKNDSHSVFPLEVKPLLVGHGSVRCRSSYWPARKTTIKGDEYFMGYTGTMGRRVWAIVKGIVWHRRKTSLFLLFHARLRLLGRPGEGSHYFIIFKHVDSLPSFFSPRSSWAWPVDWENSVLTFVDPLGRCRGV